MPLVVPALVIVAFQAGASNERRQLAALMQARAAGGPSYATGQGRPRSGTPCRPCEAKRRAMESALREQLVPVPEPEGKEAQ